jgi:hypothetical protein
VRPASSKEGIEGNAPDGLRYLVRKAGSTWEIVGQSAALTDGDLQRLLALSPQPVQFFKESEIEKLIVDYPLAIPGTEAPVATAIGLPVPGTGPADVVLVDARGRITIVECKLEANPEIRGQVIGQLLTYAAGLWRSDYEELERRFRRAKSDLTQPFESCREWVEADFRSAVSENLSSGTFRLFVASDEVPSELDQTISFLDSKSQLPVIGLLRMSLHYCAEEATEILVLEDGSERRAHPRQRARGRETIVGAVRMRDPRAAEVADELLDWASSAGMEIKPMPKRVSVEVPGRGDGVFAIEGYEAMIRVSLRRLRPLKAPEDRERVEEVLAGLERLGFAVNEKRAKAPLRALANDEDRRSEFKALMKQKFAALAT